MNAADRFLRFAAECEVMAKFSRSPRIGWFGAVWPNDGNAAPSWWTANIQMITPVL